MHTGSRRFALGLTWVLAGCVATARVPGGASPFEAPAPSGGEATLVCVEVANESTYPMRLWVQWRSLSRFLGDVPPGERARFWIPADLIARQGAPRLQADATGSADGVLTPPIELRGGRHIEFRLRRVLSNSRARVI